jgi:CRISPR system Cascade subunit CasE
MADEPVYLVRVRMRVDRLIDHGRRRKMPLHDIDLGYLAHSYLRELWPEQAPQPFTIKRVGSRWVELWGYGGSDEARLRDYAQTYGAPELVSGVELGTLASKPMPQFDSGRVVGFVLRACPVVRTKRPGKPEGQREIDAWLARCIAVGVDANSKKKHPVDRETVYREWLDERLERQGGAHLLSAQLVAFQRERLWRRDHSPERKAKKLERPDAKLRGLLRVEDGVAFLRLLAQGVGRHRAFGFGMILLQPPDRTC